MIGSRLSIFFFKDSYSGRFTKNFSSFSNSSASISAFLFSAKGGEDAIVQIYQDGQLIKEVPLQENATITIPGEYQNVIEIQDGKVAITEANCPGNDCVHIGWTSTPGASIVCLPNRLEIRIIGSDGVDLVVR